MSWKHFKNDIKPNWCPGCGHYAVQAGISRACGNLEIEPEKLALITGIGCSGRISGYINTYGFHGIHGRALPIAQGVKLANEDLTVIAAGGDGDGFAIGLNHFIHAMRRNVDMTYIVMDNHIYGMTKGQMSPRSKAGFVTKTSPFGTLEEPINILELAMTSGVTFLAQGYSRDIVELTDIIQKGISHKGFSFINILSPCVTYNQENNYEWFDSNIVRVEELEDYNTTDAFQVLKTINGAKGLLTGVLYNSESGQSFQERIGFTSENTLKKLEMNLKKDEFEELLADFF